MLQQDFAGARLRRPDLVAGAEGALHQSAAEAHGEQGEEVLPCSRFIALVKVFVDFHGW